MHPKLNSFATFIKEFQSFNALFKLHFMFSSATLLNSILFSPSLSTCGLNFHFMKNIDIIKHNFPLLELLFYRSVLIFVTSLKGRRLPWFNPFFLTSWSHFICLSSIFSPTFNKYSWASTRCQNLFEGNWIHKWTKQISLPLHFSLSIGPCALDLL